MRTTLGISQTSLKGLQNHLDRVANNVANVNTEGFKKKESSFQTLLQNDIGPNQVGLGQNAQNLAINRGLKVNQQSVDFSQGALAESNNGTDLALTGPGFFGVRDNNQQLFLTRDGRFHVDSAGVFRNSEGLVLEIEKSLPENQWPQGIPQVSETGEVRIANQVVGRIPIFDVNNHNQLSAVGENRYQLRAGAALEQNRTTQMIQGFTEGSNVDIAESMTDMIITQRSYSMNAKVLQATDEMMQRINEFKQ